ncbi:MAG: RDD family protein [Xanthomonadales bacterium]|nr:RDD family protein [Xanthomonadales bacterium]
MTAGRTAQGASGAQPAGLIRQLAVMIYDGVVLLGVLMLAAALASPFDSGNQQAGRDAVFTAYLALAWFAYLAWCWRRGGMTVGMRAWKVRIISQTGDRPSWKQCFTRFVVSLLSALCLGAGYLWIWMSPERLSWHDRASRTRLVRWPYSD